ncbi:MAG: FAD-dependent oxidoreductase [Candidatus Wildermuthbacteria bacterium]|nr:FAD-dependent oxidoreductase [Candidatus Wildermuthbacteria bacterium]
METYDVVIIGSGAAGLSAALYAGRAKMRALVIAGDFGGETTSAWTIENYPGILSIDGYELMRTMKKQAENAGVEMKESHVTALEKEGREFLVKTKEGNTLAAHSVILAVGAARRKLNLPREKELTGKGVHYCWTCDGPLYGGKTVAMVGGGDSSVKGVNFLAEYADKIYLISREKELRAEPVNLERMQKLGSKVDVLAETEIREFIGKEKLEKLALSKPFNGSGELAVDGLFIEIGFEPNKTLSLQLGVDFDEEGYIKVDNAMRTSVPGVFAAGDATNHFGDFKQDITAAALGAVAATSAYEYVKTMNS